MALVPLSGGRMVLPVGLGALDDLGFGNVGEPTERPTRAELLDESLEIITGLWTGEPFSYSGKYYRFGEMRFVRDRCSGRASDLGGRRLAAPAFDAPRGQVRRSHAHARSSEGKEVKITPKTIRDMARYVADRRTLDTPFDIVWEGQTPGDDPAKAASVVARWADAGVTWWLESRWNEMGDLDAVRTRIRQGSPLLAAVATASQGRRGR